MAPTSTLHTHILTPLEGSTQKRFDDAPDGGNDGRRHRLRARMLAQFGWDKAASRLTAILRDAGMI